MSFKPDHSKPWSSYLHKALPPKAVNYDVSKSKTKNVVRNKASREKCKIQKVNLNTNSSLSSDTFSSVKYESWGSLRAIPQNESVSNEDEVKKEKYHSSTRISYKNKRKVDFSSKPNKNKSIVKVPFFDLKENQFYKKYNMSETSESNISPSRFYETKV